MRISTKIIAGYGILIALMAGLLAHEMVTIHRMQSIISKVSDVNFRIATAALELKRDLNTVDSMTRKSFISVDPDYREQLRVDIEQWGAHLGAMESLEPSQEDLAEIRRLQGFWNSFTVELAQQQAVEPQDQLQGIPASLSDRLDQLWDQTDSVYQASISRIDAEVGTFKRTGRMAETVSWIMAAVALLLSVMVSFLIVQSISSPLKQLTQGTRAIAQGKFYYRLDTTRNDEFAQLARDFNTMTHRLSELDQMKKDFVSHVSHELKAPLASMQETIQLLLEQIAGPLSDKQRRILELNLASARRLSAMIGNLLDVSRLEAGVLEYELKSNDLVALVRNAAAELQAQADEHSLALTIEVPDQPIVVECDSDRIMQVIRNLIGNAIKFSPKGGDIGVRLLWAAETPQGIPADRRGQIASWLDGKGCALLTVTDSGPGVPDEHKERIFEKFHQVKQGRKIPGQGVGLGLAISRTIAEAHRGAIWVEDNPDGGSIFSVAIPPGEGSGEITYRASSPI